MNKNTLYIIGGIAAIGTAAYFYNQSVTSVELLPENTVPANTPVATKKPATNDNVKKVQTFLNSVMGALPPLVVDGISGPSTINRIKEFQKTVGRGNPVTGTWGTITEGNALAVYGFTPFQGKKAVLVPATTKSNPTPAQLVEQGRLRALLINKYAYGRSSLRLYNQPSLVSPIKQTLNSFTTQAVGQIADVAFSVVNGNQYAFLQLKWAQNVKGWALLTDVDIYPGPSKVLSTKVIV